MVEGADAGRFRPEQSGTIFILRRRAPRDASRGFVVNGTGKPLHHADVVYALDRDLDDATSAAEFARAALDVLAGALEAAYSGLTYGKSNDGFRCGDAAIASDLEALIEALSELPLLTLAGAGAWTRDALRGAGLETVERVMTLSGLYVAVPLTCGGQLRGVLALGPRSDGRAYCQADIDLCSRISGRLSLMASRHYLSIEVDRLRSLAARQERMAVVGQMAAGLAHEIRNPLVSIRTFTQLLPERYEDEEFRSGFLDLTLAEIDRISALVGELLNFARPEADTPPPRRVEVADALERTCMLLRSQARGAGVVLDLELAADIPDAGIDEDRLRQVVLNLIVNAIQASRGRGRVVVSARSEAADQVCVEVYDDGPGMPPEIARQVFEPFFTTRAEGTGLGLALARRIVGEHGGRLELETKVGHGARFFVHLPTADSLQDQPTVSMAING